MVKVPYMDATDLKRLIAESGQSDRQISLKCGEREDFVRDIKQGVKPAFDSVFRLLEVLGYEIHITPIEGGEAGPGESAKSVKTLLGFYTLRRGRRGPRWIWNWGATGGLRRRWRRLLSIMSRTMNMGGDTSSRRLRSAGPSCSRWKTPLSRVVSGLGWEVLPARENAKGD